jgi:hypothetical protein
MRGRSARPARLRAGTRSNSSHLNVRRASTDPAQTRGHWSVTSSGVESRGILAAVAARFAVVHGRQADKNLENLNHH